MSEPGRRSRRLGAGTVLVWEGMSVPEGQDGSSRLHTREWTEDLQSTSDGSAIPVRRSIGVLDHAVRKFVPVVIAPRKMLGQGGTKLGNGVYNRVRKFFVSKMQTHFFNNRAPESF